MKHYHKLLLFGLLLAVIWTMSIYFFHNRIVEAEKNNIYRTALKEAEVAFEKDLTYRRWVAGLGGLYAEISTKLPPNEHLYVPNRDVTTTGGKKMTMINPAYMMRMVYGMMDKEAGLHGHITSLNPIRPANIPTEWEAEVLKSFPSNPSIFHELAMENGKTVLHFMRPLITEKACLKCHAQQGYKEGEIRGGISVTVPMSGYQQTLDAFIIKTNISFLTIWIAGIIFITGGFLMLSRYEQARSQAEEELGKTKNYLANIINSMPSILVGVDPDGNVTHWNMEAEKFSNLSSREAVGRPLAEALPKMQDELEKILAAMKKRSIATDSMQTRINGGITRYDDITIYPLIANGVQGAVIRIDDVTERIYLEQMMIQSEKMMSVGGLAAGMAHEINNPLAGIMGHAQNMQKRLLSDMEKNKSVAAECDISLEQLHQYLEKRQIPKMMEGILESGKRAAKIVSNMLNFSRKSESDCRHHHLPELLDNTIELAANDYNLKKHYDFRKIDIVRQYAPDIPPVFCAGTEIQQVFLNLLKNGAEAMTEKEYEQDSPKFICRIKIENDMVVIEIEDNGSGITIEPKSRIFDPFYTSKAVGKGTGLGLSVSYFIIADQHNGVMEVESVPGEWTRFTIKLPLK
ncbi:ATP-binding protein [Desulfovibrio sp. JC022]|uniref:ATP-binding protein n=1 Tax=Desulfovibrio sp. JC022 TaxID=2593642 RepID=UPI0013D2B3BB|nr:ATP-binding protein [Desulfovibrio sp. JC022]NDV22928.1 DUF3365 domain-containing protein [Desulfovibrio sp. JC022]